MKNDNNVINPSLNISSRIILQDGHSMPLMGFGVWAAKPGNETYDAVLYALKSGYRHIDTAQMYANEKEVGEAVRDSGIPRDKVFITTKLWESDYGYDAALKAFDQSLLKLDLDYVDLYMIHWPDKRFSQETWSALERIREERLSRSIGVSNYAPIHLRELLDKGKECPMVNQIELNPFLQQETIAAFCRKERIHLTGYCPLARGKRFEDPNLKRIAVETLKSPAQVMIRWGLQRGQSVIPKSVHTERIDENANVFDFSLNEEQMQTLNGLDDSFRLCSDPLSVVF